MADSAQVVRDAYDAFARQDIPGVLGTLDEAVEWDVSEVLPQGGSFRGQDGVGEFFQGLGQVWEGLDVDVEELLEAGDHVVAIGRARGKLRGGGDASYGFVHIFTLDRAKVTRFREWGDPDAALQAAAADR